MLRRFKPLVVALAAAFEDVAYRAVMGFMTRQALVRYVDPPAAGAAAPAAGAPPAAAAAASATPATAGGTTEGAAAAPSNVVAGAGEAAKPGDGATPPTTPVEPTKEERAAYLTGKGLKAEELAKLDEAGIKAKFDELKAADVKAADIAKIEIKVPEGAVIDEQQMGAFKEIIADAKLSPTERAQKLIDMHSAALTRAIEEPVKVWMDMQKTWQDAVKADPELGGAKFAETEKALSTALDQLAGAKGSKERLAVENAFILTGAGNNPEIVRLLTRAGKALGEGKIVSGAPPGSGTRDDLVRAMYPSASDSQAAAAR